MAVRAHRPSSVSTKLIARKTAFRLLLTEFSLSKLPIPFFPRYARRNFHALSQTLPEIFCIPPCIHENEMFGTGCEVHNIGGSPSRLTDEGSQIWILLGIHRTSRRPISGCSVARQTGKTPRRCRSCYEKFHGSTKPLPPCD